MTAPLTRYAIAVAKTLARHARCDDEEIDHEHLKLRIQNRRGFGIELTEREVLWDISFCVPGEIQFNSDEEFRECFLAAAKHWRHDELIGAIYYYGRFLALHGYKPDKIVTIKK